MCRGHSIVDRLTAAGKIDGGQNLDFRIAPLYEVSVLGQNVAVATILTAPDIQIRTRCVWMSEGDRPAVKSNVMRRPIT